MDLPRIAQALLERAYYAEQELVWRRADVVQVIDDLAQNDYLLLGGEVWMISEDGRITVTFPTTASHVPAIYTWSYQPSAQNALAHWHEECARSARYNKHVIQTISPEQDIDQAYRHQVWYNLTYVDQEEYSIL